MKQTKQDLYQQVEALNELLGGEKYFLEVLSYEVYGPYRFSLGNKNGSGRPLCTWDRRMLMSEMYQYLRAAIAAIGAYKTVNNLNN